MSDDESDSAWSDDEGGSSSDNDNDAPLLLQRKRTILWLCQEGQLRRARRRFDALLATPEEHETLQKEVFQMDGRDKNYPLHEILMGGTSDRNAYRLTLSILSYATTTTTIPPPQHMRHIMLARQPPSHGRTALHWAVWGNASLDILRPMVRAHPEALLVRDHPRQGGRTPLELYRHYYYGGGGSNHNNNASDDDDDDDASSNPYQTKLKLLEAWTTSWTAHRLRLAVLLCANRYFHDYHHNHHNNDNTTAPPKLCLTPFSKTDRRRVRIPPKPWFYLSVIGYLQQREMEPLVVRILSFVGGNAKATTTTKHNKNKNKKKRKR